MGVLSVLTACGSGSTTTPALIRLVNASTVNSTLELSLNETYNTAATPATPNSAIASAYVSVPPGTYTESVFATSGVGLSSGTQNVGLGTGQSYTTIAYNRGSGVYFATITDDLSTPPTGEATVDFANISPDIGQVDIYVLQTTAANPITSLTGLTATISSLSQVSQAIVLNAGTYDVFVTPAGSPSDIRLHLTSLPFVSGQIATIALTSTQGGALVNGVLINQGGSAQNVPNTQARVRVFSALPVSADAGVEVSIPGATAVGSTAPASGGNLPLVYAPTHTVYVPVDLASGASTQISSVTVNGVAVSGLPTTALTSGGDYTVLVYGTVASPLVAVFSDDNQLISNQPSVRVINAAVTAPGGINMIVNTIEDAETVAYGAASPYSGVPNAGGSTDSVLVIGSGYNQSTTTSLVSGSVYTVFVYDPTQPPLVFLDN